MSFRSRLLIIGRNLLGLRHYSHSISSELLPVKKTSHAEVPIDFKTDYPITACYGGRYIMTMIIGIGLGQELYDLVNDVFTFAHVPVDFEPIHVKNMNDVEDAMTSITRNGAALKTNIEGSKDFFKTANINPNVLIRQGLDLYLNIVHCKPYKNFVITKFSDIDLVLIRQNTEGEYAMLEHEPVPGVIESLKIITKYNSQRIAHSAFQYAREFHKKKITVVHKANILKVTDGLFLDTAMEVSKRYPDIIAEEMMVDNCCMQLVNNNIGQFEVILVPNLYGSIISNIICGLLGGPGLHSGSNYGSKYAVFEPASRSVGIDIYGKNLANPVAILNAACDMLEHLKLNTYAQLLEKAIYVTISDNKIFTQDLGGKFGTSDVVAAIKENIDKYRYTYISK